MFENYDFRLHVNEFLSQVVFVVDILTQIFYMLVLVKVIFIEKAIMTKNVAIMHLALLLLAQLSLQFLAQ